MHRRFLPVLNDFPELQLCFGGAGAGVRDVGGSSAADQMLALAEDHANVWLDVDDWQRPELGLE